MEEDTEKINEVLVKQLLPCGVIIKDHKPMSCVKVYY